MPICIECNEELGKLYSNGKCRKCYTTEYRDKNIEEIKEYRQNWQKINPGKHHEYIKKCRSTDNKGQAYLKAIRNIGEYIEYLYERRWFVYSISLLYFVNFFTLEEYL